MPKPASNKGKRGEKRSSLKEKNFKIDLNNKSPSKKDESDSFGEDDLNCAKLLVMVQAISGLEGNKLKHPTEIKYPLDVTVRSKLGSMELGSSQIFSIPDNGTHSIDYNIVHYLPKNKIQKYVTSQPLILTLTSKASKSDRHRRTNSKGKDKDSLNEKSSLSSSKTASGDVLLESQVDLLPLALGETEVEEKVGGLLEVIIRLDGATTERPDNLLYVTVQSIYNPPSEFLGSDTTSITADINLLPDYQHEEQTEDEWWKLKFNNGKVISVDVEPEVPEKRWFSVGSGAPSLSQYRNILGEDRIKDPEKLSQNKEDRSLVRISWNQMNRVFLNSSEQEKLLRSLIEKDGRWFLTISTEKKHVMEFKKKHTPQNVESPEQTPQLNYFAWLDLSDLLQPGVNCTRVVTQLEQCVDELNVEESVSKSLSNILQKQNVPDKSPQMDSSQTKAPVCVEGKRRKKVEDSSSRPCYITVLVELYKSIKPRRTQQQIQTSVKQYVKERMVIPTDTEISSPLKAHAKYRAAILDSIKFLNQEYEFYRMKKSRASEKCLPEIRSESEVPSAETYQTLPNVESTIVCDNHQTYDNQQNVENKNDNNLNNKPNTCASSEADEQNLDSKLTSFLRDGYCKPQYCQMKKSNTSVKFSSQIKSESEDLSIETCQTILNEEAILIPDNDQTSDKQQDKENMKNYSDYCFKNELNKSGALDTVRQNLHSALTSYFRDSDCKPQTGLCDVYCKVMEETQRILEENCTSSNASENRILSSSVELLTAAIEASENEDYNRAQQFLFKRIHFYDEKNADNWTDLAVISLRHGDVARAKSSLLTALCLNPRHCEALLISGVLLSDDGQYENASLMFEALTTFYPRFYRAWFIYYCFYETIENKNGYDVCLSLGSVCLRDKDRNEGKIRPTFWAQDLVSPEADGFILTAVYLLSLNLCQFAEMCLKEHKLEVNEHTVSYLYYLAVSHHIQGKYSESNSHLKQAISISWADENLWNLMGHNLYKISEWERASDCYQMVLDNPDPPAQYGLSYYRMGVMTMMKGDYDSSRKYFLRSVSLSSSPLAWIGLAKALYWKNELDDAELAAREANRLDDRAGSAWAILALVNYRNCTLPDIARQCLSIANQHGIDDEQLLQEIDRVCQLFGEKQTDTDRNHSSNNINNDYEVLSSLRACF